MFGIVLSLMLQEEGGGNRQYIELLSDAGKLLTDIHHTETVAKNHKNETETVNQSISTFNNSKRACKLSQSTSLQAGVSPRWTPAPTDPPLQSSPQRTGTFNISQEPAPRAAQLSQGKDLQEIEQVNKPAGSLLFFHSEWSKITDDKMLLSWIKGSPNRLPQKKALLDYAKRIAQYGNYKHDSHQYVSNILLRKKQDGSERVILNLKSLNKFIKTAHFKMEDQKLMCFSNEITLVLEFLTHHFKLWASYGTLNSYRSALDRILDPQIAQDYRIKRFFKGIYNLRSNCPNTPIHGTQNWSLIS
nr:unnamed protein product [Callosobruchus chinensis]